MAISNFAALTVTINGGLSSSVGQSAHTSFDQFIAFGDSTIDSGYFLTHTISNNASREALYQQAAAAGGGKPTDPNQPENSELLAQSYGLTAIPVGMLGGTNYAASGATETGVVNANSLAPSVTSQISTYLGSTGGVADPNALYYFAGGGNDLKVAQGMSSNAAAQNYMISEADSLAASIVQLKNGGAQYFVLDDQNGANGSSFSVVYDDRLWSDLASAGIQFTVADDNVLLRRMTNNPQNYGITNTTKPPVGPFSGGNPYSTSNGGAVINPNPSLISDSWALYGTQDVSASAANTYLWADDEHLAEAGQRAVANYTHSAIEHAAPIVSETLQATIVNPFAAQNGVANTTYQWQHLQNGQTTWTDISGATSSSYTVASTDAGTELRVEGFYSDTNGNSASAVSPASYAVVAPIANNFSGAGHSGIVWQNADGTPAIWTMDGTNLTQGQNIGASPGSDWHVIGSGDFNGDGASDILWQNKDGTIAEWFLNGTSLVSGGSVAFNPGPAWHAIGAADFDGNGKSDILWQNDDGTPAVWLMDGLNILSGANVGFNPGPSWHVIGAADFNGDGKADILWQNKDGTPAVWLMNGTNLISGSNVGFNPGADWHIVGTGDFNGDGKADILWQNKDGTPAVWLMNGTNLISGSNVGFNPGASWHAVGTGDFNGDGKSDILWQNDDGTSAVWLMNGTNVTSGANVGSDPGSNWHVVPQHHDLLV